MAILGWLVLTGLALFVTFGGLIGLYANSALGGRIGGEVLAFVVVAAGLCYLSYDNFPFVLAMKP